MYNANVTGVFIVMLYLNKNPFIPLTHYFSLMYKCIFVFNAFILIRWAVRSHFLFILRRPLQSESCPAGESIKAPVANQQLSPGSLTQRRIVRCSQGRIHK